MKRSTPLSHAAMAALVSAGLAGCAAGNATPAALTTAAIPTGQARITVERPMAYLYSGAPATITANGKNVASLWGGGSSSFFIPAGESTIAASAWSYPGEFKVKLNAAAGADYKLVVEPRGDSFVPGALLGPIGGAIDASVNENAGAFQMRVAGG